MSLNAKNARLVPLAGFNDDEENIGHSFVDTPNDIQVGYYDIKIHNENMEKIDHSVFKSYKKSNSYVAIPFTVSKKDIGVTNALSSGSSSSILGTNSSYSPPTYRKSRESLVDTSILSSSPGESECTTPLSSVSQTSLTALASPKAQRASNHQLEEFCDPLTQPVKVEYVPKGKMITINVSIMW